MQYLYVTGTMLKCLPTGGVRLQEVSISGGSTVFHKICSCLLVYTHEK